jgi:hypothetical protein
MMWWFKINVNTCTFFGMLMMAYLTEMGGAKHVVKR